MNVIRSDQIRPPAEVRTLVWALSVALLCVAVAGCKSGRSSERDAGLRAEESVQRIAARLIDAAEQRTDLSSMRVVIDGVREAQPRFTHPIPSLARAQELETISAELEHELVMALSDRLHILDTRGQAASAPSSGPVDVGALAEHWGATHALVGEFVCKEDDLVVSVRLVEADSLLIVAAARGVVPVAGLSDWTRLALESKPPVLLSQRKLERVELPPAGEPEPVATPPTELAVDTAALAQADDTVKYPPGFEAAPGQRWKPDAAPAVQRTTSDPVTRVLQDLERTYAAPSPHRTNLPTDEEIETLLKLAGPAARRIGSRRGPADRKP